MSCHQNTAVITTKRAARELGLRTADEWMRAPRKGRPCVAPRHDAKPTIVEGEEFFALSDCEETLSRTEAKRRELMLRPNAEPVAYLSAWHGKWIQYPVYRRSDYVSKPYTGREYAAELAVETKRAKVRAYATSIKIEVPRIEFDKLVREACDHYNFGLREHESDLVGADERSDPRFLARITVNYLRHCATQYHSHLDAIAGNVGAGEAYWDIKCAVLSAIGNAYPNLREECERQAGIRLSN